MNEQIKNLLAEVESLDMYTQLSVLGSWNYSINAACINAALRHIPAVPDENGIADYTAWEQAVRTARFEASEDGRLGELLSLRDAIMTAVEATSGEPRELDSTLEFMLERVPTAKQFEAEYEARRRQGMRVGIPLAKFVQAELATALERHAKLAARGGDAIKLCKQLLREDIRGDGELPEYIVETFESKMMDKLHARWEKLELVRTNFRARKQQRDAAYADQLLIKQLIEAHGESVGYSEEELEAA